MEAVVGMEVDESAVDMELVRSVSFSCFLDVSFVEKMVKVDLNAGPPKVGEQTTAYYEKEHRIRKQNRDTLRTRRDQWKTDMLHRGCCCKTSEEDACRF